MRTQRLIIVAVLALTALATCSPAQTAVESNLPAAGFDQPPPTLPTLHIYSRETIVDVTVTDSHGNPVHGLKQSDFIVEQDGKPEAIRSFQEFFATPSPSQPAPVLPPNTYSNRQPTPTAGALNIILLDGINNNGDSFGQARAVEAAQQYLKSLPPGTRVAVATLISTHLRVLQDFTSDRELLSAALRNVVADLQDDSNQVIQPMDLVQASGGHIHSTVMEADCQAENTRDRATLEAVNQLSASLARIKGKKNVIWFAWGFASITDPSFNVIHFQGCLPDYSVPLNKALALLAGAQVAVYPISTLRVHPPDLDPETGYSIPAVETLSLEAIAEATGGVAYHDTNDLAGALANAVKTGSDYYTLSYVPPDAKFDTRRHSITVHTDLPGVQLNYRDTYVAEDLRQYSPTPTLGIGTALPHVVAVSASSAPPVAGSSHHNFNAAFHAAMAHGSAESTQILFDIHVDPSVEPTQSSDPALFGTLDRRYRGKLLARYAFRSSLDASQLALIAGDDLVYHGAVDFTLAAFDAEGKQVTVLTQTVAVRLDDYGYKQFLAAPFALLQQLDLPSGHYFLRAGILDRTSGKIGSVEFPIDVPNLLPIPITSLHSPPAAQPATPPTTPPSREPTPTLQRRPPSP